MNIPNNLLTALLLFLLICGTFIVVAKLINAIFIYTTDSSRVNPEVNLTMALCMLDAALWTIFYYSTH